MSHVLAANIVAVEPSSGAVRVFLAEEEPPEWVYAQARSPETWVGGNVPDAVDVEPSAPADGSPPPRGGAGSGVGAWREYAAANHVHVSDGATRDDIISACESAGIRTA